MLHCHIAVARRSCPWRSVYRSSCHGQQRPARRILALAPQAQGPTHNHVLCMSVRKDMGYVCITCLGPWTIDICIVCSPVTRLMHMCYTTDYRLAAVCAAGRIRFHWPPACTPTAESPDIFLVARVSHALCNCAAAVGTRHATGCSVYDLVLCDPLHMLLYRHHLAEVCGWGESLLYAQRRKRTYNTPAPCFPSCLRHIKNDAFSY